MKSNIDTCREALYRLAEGKPRMCVPPTPEDDDMLIGTALDQLEKAQKIKTINALVRDAHQNAIDKGWYEEPRTFAELIALMHSELSEALEDYRAGRAINEIYYEGEKPCGIPIELADVLIRIFDTCGYYGIDLEEAIEEKMRYNATRPQRHGGKRL